jgi:hypothetical protein
LQISKAKAPVNVLVNTKAGDTFSFKEISGWPREAGFKNPRRLEVPAVSPPRAGNQAVTQI